MLIHGYHHPALYEAVLAPACEASWQSAAKSWQHCKQSKFWTFILLITGFTLKCRRWNFKPRILKLSCCHKLTVETLFDSKLETLMCTIWLHRTAFTSAVLAIPRAALVHTPFIFFPFTFFTTVLQKSDTKNLVANQNIIFYSVWQKCSNLLQLHSNGTAATLQRWSCNQNILLTVIFQATKFAKHTKCRPISLQMFWPTFPLNSFQNNNNKK